MRRVRWHLPKPATNQTADVRIQPGSPAEVFLDFSILGVTSFGGTVAHPDDFREVLVECRGWFTESQFGQTRAF